MKHTPLCSSLWQKEEVPRPSTTDWEKFADQLAKSRKFHPYESFAHSQNYLSVYKDYTSMRDKPGHYDGHFSEGNSLSSTLSDLSSGHLTPAPPRRRHGHRDYAKFVGSEQPGSVSRASSRLSNGGPARTFDFNPQRDRISLPIGNTSSRVGSRVGSAALNGRRSLWARGQPDVLHEEPHVYSPVAMRRSSMTTGLGIGGLRAVRDERGLLAARSTSSLATSPLPARIDGKKNGHKGRQAKAEPIRSISPRPIGVETKARQSIKERRTSEPYKDIPPLRTEGTSQSLSTKSIKDSPSPRFAMKDLKKEDNKELSGIFKSLLLDSARNISTTVMLATPTMNDTNTHSPSRKQFHVEQSTTSKTSKSPTPLASRSSTFIADTTESHRSSKLATPTETSKLPSPRNPSPASSRASPKNRGSIRTSPSNRDSLETSPRNRDSLRTSPRNRDKPRTSNWQRDHSGESQMNIEPLRTSPRNRDSLKTSPRKRDSLTNSPRNKNSVSTSPRNRDTPKASNWQRDHFRDSPINRDPLRTSPKNRDPLKISPRNRDSLGTSPIRKDSLSTSPRNKDAPRASNWRRYQSRDSPMNRDPPSASLMPSHHTSKTATPLVERIPSVHRTPSRMPLQDDPTPKRLPTAASRASRAASSLSSGSSTEIVIKPLSHLNTPSAVSLSPDQVVLTEYEDVDLEAALARLADWRGSTTTLHSTHSNSSRIGRTSHTSSRLGSRRTSPWIRHHTEHSSVPRSGFVDLATPTKLTEQLDRCEICCTEIVMKWLNALITELLLSFCNGYKWIQSL